MSNPEPKRTTHTMQALNQSQIELMEGYIRDEKRESQVLRVVSGKAWITMDGEDFLLGEGDEIKLSHGKHKAVISASGHEPLIYEFEHEEKDSE